MTIITIILFLLFGASCSSPQSTHPSKLEETREDSLKIREVKSEFLRISLEEDPNLVGIVCSNCEKSLGYFQALDKRKDFFIINSDTVRIEEELSLENIHFYLVKGKSFEVTIAKGTRSSSSGNSLKYSDYYLLTRENQIKRTHLVSNKDVYNAITELINN